MNCIVEHLEAALIGASLDVCDDVSRLLWQAYEAGEISDVDAGAVSEAVAARREAIKSAGSKRPTTPPRPSLPKRREPRSPDRAASIARRRKVTASGALPPGIACQFTPAETAALSIIAAEIKRSGKCELHVDAIAGRAGTCRRVVQYAVAHAVDLGFLHRQERRRSYSSSDTNVLTIKCDDWAAWQRLGYRVHACAYDQQIPKIYRKKMAQRPQKGLFEMSKGRDRALSYANSA